VLTEIVLHCTLNETQEIVMSESTFTLRVDNELKEAFTRIAKLQDRTGAQLVREFMREIVQRAQTQKDYDTWFAHKVAEGRADYALGHVVSNEDVMIEAEERQQKLLARLGHTV